MSQISQTIYLDLDRTLFRTDDFTVPLWQTIAELYDRPEYAAEASRVKEYYLPNDVQPLYGLAHHAASVGIRDRALFDKLANSKLSQTDWLYPGADELITWLRARGAVEVLTWGEDDFQSLKLQLCPLLTALPAHIIQTNKATWLKDRAPALIVDDRPLAPQLKGSGVDAIQILHADARSTGNVAWPVVGSLVELLEYLKQNIDK